MLYKTILVDPPWAEIGGGQICRGAQRHYSVVKDSEIYDVIVGSPLWRPDPAGCHLWLWVTNNRLPLGLKIMERLGFTYKTNLVWVKDRFGLGQYLRGMHEICLFGVMGRPMLPSVRNIPSVITAKRREHSRKPDAMYDVIEAVSPAPRAELFARNMRPGWDAWGDQLQVPLVMEVFDGKQD